MSQQTIKILDDLARRFGIFIDWNSKNVIPYLQNLISRYVKYNLSINILGLSLSIFWICFLVLLFVKREKIEKLIEDSFYEVIFYCGICIISMIALIMMISCPIEIIKCLTVPEKLIIDMIQNMNRI